MKRGEEKNVWVYFYLFLVDYMRNIGNCFFYCLNLGKSLFRRHEIMKDILEILLYEYLLMD